MQHVSASGLANEQYTRADVLAQRCSGKTGNKKLEKLNLPSADADVGCSCPRRSAIPRNTISVGVAQPIGGDFADIIP